MHENKFVQQLQEAYEKAVGYEWDGYKAPEQRPEIRRQVKALATLVDERLQLIEDQLAVIATTLLTGSPRTEPLNYLVDPEDKDAEDIPF